MQIHPAARRHGVSDEDMEHALAHALAWVELDDDPPRYLVIGPATTANLLELVVLAMNFGDLIIHAMELRRATEREVFGEATDD